VKKLICTIISIIFALVFILPVFASNLENAYSRKISIDSQLNDVYKDRKEIKSEKSQLEKEKEELLKSAEKENEMYKEILDKINSIEGEISVIDKTLKESIENYLAQKQLLKIRLRVMYERLNTSFIEILFESKSITDIFETLELMATISKRDKQLVNELETAKKDIEYKKEMRVEEKSEKINIKTEKEERIEELSTSRTALDEQIRKSEEELSRLEKREDELLRLSSSMVDYIKQLQKTSGYVGGAMTWPAPDSREVVSPFGMRIHPIYRKLKMHTGVDINARYGTSIVAANKGTVILSGYSGGYGYRIVVDHGGGISTLYAHCSRLFVRVGDGVKSGQTIGKIGSTGLSTGPHLHFEVRKNGVPKDPLEWITP
jgi:murein DD-endopeptidase MepM/ murein hydrolase activator NlpD